MWLICLRFYSLSMDLINLRKAYNTLLSKYFLNLKKTYVTVCHIEIIASILAIVHKK